MALTQIQTLQSGTGAVHRTLDDTLSEIYSVKDFGAKGDGTTDDRAAIQAAITAAQVTGGTVWIPEGEYIINGAASTDDAAHAIYKKNGLLIPFKSANGTDDHISIVGAGRSTVLKAGESDMYVIRLSDSHCRVENLTIDNNSKAEIVGIGVVPESRTQTTTTVWQVYNVISGLYIKECQYATIFATGPDVSTADSGCWYNMFRDSHFYKCTTGILLDTSTNSTSSASGVNRNKFQNIRIGADGSNTGVEIKDGDTNTFFMIDFEGVNDGTTPNSTPTAIKVAATGASSGGDCNHNTFISCKFENCTRDIDVANRYTEFYACNYSASKLLLTQTPLIMLGGNDTSQAPQHIAGYVYQGNSQIAGHNNNIASFTNGITASKALFTGTVLNSYGEFISHNFGTIAASASSVATIAEPRNNEQTYMQIYVVGRENTNSGTFVIRAEALANWTGTTAQTVGIAVGDRHESLGIADYRTYAGATVSLAFSSNNLQLTVTNSSGSGTLQEVIAFVKFIWSE